MKMKKDVGCYIQTSCFFHTSSPSCACMHVSFPLRMILQQSNISPQDVFRKKIVLSCCVHCRLVFWLLQKNANSQFSCHLALRLERPTKKNRTSIAPSLQKKFRWWSMSGQISNLPHNPFKYSFVLCVNVGRPTICFSSQLIFLNIIFVPSSKTR